MFRSRIIHFFAAALCLVWLALPAKAIQVDCGSTYCFAPEDFSDTQPLAGICITGLPESRTGTLLLGTRVIRQGDILTTEQAGQMTFSPLQTPTDQTTQMTYLPIYADHVAASSTMTIRIAGREDKPPVAEDSAAETYKNLESTGKLKVSDPEGQMLTYTITRQPKRGTVSLAEDGSFTYTPKKNKIGIDSFAYTAADPAGNVSREATVTITIHKASDSTLYTDTVGRDCRFSAEWMKRSGIFAGEKVGDQSCFQPDKEVTRGEFVSMLVKTLDIPTDEYLTYTGYTDDIPKWLQPYLAAAIRSGIIAGLPNQEVFGANESITGAEAAVMLKNVLNLPVSRETIQSQEDPLWAESAMAAIRELQLPLDAMAPVTREAAAQVLYQSSLMAEEAANNELV